MTSVLNNFVNGTRNVCWLSGYVKRQDRNSVRICSSSDAETGILVTVSPTAVVPPNDEYTEVSCHVFGTYNPDTDARDLLVKAIHFKRPGISAVPRRVALLQAASNVKTPLATIAEIREGLMKKVLEVVDVAGLVGGMTPEALVSDMVRDAQRGAPARGSSFTNKVILTGFVGAKRVVMPSEDEGAHIQMSLHQYADSARAIPVRIYGNISSFAKELKTLFPINLVGSISFRDIEQDGVLRRETFIVAGRQDIGMAAQADFFRKAFPSWWLTAFAEHRRRSQARQETVRAAPVSSEPKSVATTKSGIDLTDVIEGL
ncbi:MAG: hypothetical protein DDT25_01047 [Chloroflexi bacterium]|nr:hypothetical protein [Chloroflexota bacterium]